MTSVPKCTNVSDFLPRNEKTLVGVEKKHGIRVRWQEADATFANAQQRLTVKKRNSQLLKLQKMASERIFLLELKAKYAGLHTLTYNGILSQIIEHVFELFIALLFHAERGNSEWGGETF